ncbi:HAD family hydrolase [Vallitalea guaymasensis]|uniref:HAD family hydrolase n=1 Tax=Vallitalea guaymasensis TaxID=1185412 RepID=UPI002357A8A6|nr:HAD family phosphatase [Vallitalea guaymasensis]
MKTQGIIFDFNGTMFYDGKIQEESWKTFLYKKIGREITNEEFHKYVHGCHAEVSFSYFLKNRLSKEEIDQLAEEKEVVYRKLCLLDKQQYRLADGLVEFLDYLKKQQIPFTIATASGLNNLKFFFENLNLGKWFNIEQVVYDNGLIPSKPEPDIYIKAAQNIGVSPGDCIVFEDAISGIEAANRAGVSKIIGVASSLSKEQLQQIPDISMVIEDYRDVKNLINFIE